METINLNNVHVLDYDGDHVDQTFDIPNASDAELNHAQQERIANNAKVMAQPIIVDFYGDWSDVDVGRQSLTMWEQNTDFSTADLTYGVGMTLLKRALQYNDRLIVLNIWGQNGDLDTVTLLPNDEGVYRSMPVPMNDGNGRRCTVVFEIENNTLPYIRKINTWDPYVWIGTQTQYDAIATPDAGTLYIIVEASA